MSESPHLWFDAGRTRFYAIPDTAELPMGDLILHDVGGRHRGVEGLAAGVYEITKAEAEAETRARLAEAVNRAKEAFRGMLDLAPGKDPTPDNPIGKDLDAFLRDPALVRDRLTAIIEEAGAGFRAGIGAKPGPKVTIPITEPLREFGVKLREVLVAPEVAQAIRGVGEAFGDFAVELERHVKEQAGEAAKAAEAKSAEGATASKTSSAAAAEGQTVEKPKAEKPKRKGRATKAPKA